MPVMPVNVRCPAGFAGTALSGEFFANHEGQSKQLTEPGSKKGIGLG